jgi:predicted metalloprotease with PDZ domain
MNISGLCPLILLFAACRLGHEAPTTGSKPRYTVAISEENIRHVDIEAILPLETDTILMSQIMDVPLDQGYAQFVEDLNAFDDKGTPVNINAIGRSGWKLELKMPAVVKLKYQVLIDHDKIDWNVSSAFARGYILDDAVFFVGRILFITPTRFQEPVEIEYSLPNGWDVASCLTALPGKSHMFLADSRGKLLNNGNLLGKLTKAKINVGSLQVEIAGPASMHESIALFHDAMESVVNTYQSQMGGAPSGKLEIIAALSYAHASGGEAFPNSISMMFNMVPNASNKSYWGYMLAHEIYHLWNGHSIRPANQSEVEWFVEGFTQYMSRRTAYRTGFMSEGDFNFEMTRAIESYTLLAGSISFKDAGRDKGGNFRLIYDGGMVIAYRLDSELKKVTGNKGLEDFMRAMFDKFGKTGKTYEYEDIVKTATEVAGKDMSSFFGDYVAGTKVMDVK